MHYCPSSNNSDLVTWLLQGGAVRDFCIGHPVTDVDVLVFADPKISRDDKLNVYSHNESESCNAEPFGYFSYGFKEKKIKGFSETTILGELEYPSQPGCDFSVVRVKFQNKDVTTLLEKYTINETVDIILIETPEYKQYIDTHFDFGLCKVMYDRFGLHKTNHFLLDSENYLISIVEDDVSKEQLFNILTRDHLQRIKQKYPQYKPLLIDRATVNNYDALSSITISSKDGCRLIVSTKNE